MVGDIRRSRYRVLVMLCAAERLWLVIFAEKAMHL